MRIFTPKRELPFAGHPTIGTAALIAHRRAGDLLAAQDLRIVLEEAVGDVVCSRAPPPGPGARRLLSTCRNCPSGSTASRRRRRKSPRASASSPDDIGFDRHEPSLFSAGAPYLFVPVRSLDAIAPRRAGRDALGDQATGPRPFFTRAKPRRTDRPFTRACSLATGACEDPATGSAAAAFAGVVQAFDRPGDGEHTLTIEQGFEMGRPSLIALSVTIEAGALAAATIGGSVVIVSSGSLDL